MLFIILSLTIIFLLNLIILFINFKLKDINKTYSFECGFNPFFTPHNPFSIQFFKILLVFIIFDLEIIIIIPISTLKTYFLLNFSTIITIIIILTLGLYFELKEGSLKWLK